MVQDTKKRLLITGVSGLLGNNLAYCLKDRYEILGLYNAHPAQIPGVATHKVDITSVREAEETLAGFRPDIVVHCAALSDIDYCEEHQESTHTVNVEGTRTLVKGIEGRPVKFIYISTDAVYANANGQPLREDDRIDPPNYYGKTKYSAEQEALRCPGAVVLRTNIFGWNIQEKYSLAEWVVHELSRRKEIQGFHDAYFSSIYTFDLARLIDEAIKKDICGTYNCGSRTSLSKYEFARKVADAFHLEKKLIKSIGVDQFGFKAKRGKNLALDVTRLERALNVEIPTIEESILRFHEDFQQGLPGRIKAAAYPQLDYIPYGRQVLDDEDIEAVVAVLKSKYLTQGPKSGEFEEELKKVTGAAHAVAVNSGTSALHIACLAAGVGPGDEVITSPNTFVASANCIVYCGATPVFADIDAKTYNIDPQEVEKKITARTKAVIPVHFAGQSADMTAIRDIVRSKEKEYGHKIYVIEDACHALGSRYKDTAVGSCAYGDMAVMSFHPVKHVTTGEGGVVFTNDKSLYRKLSYLRSHGITNTPEEILCREEGFEPASEGSGNPVLRPWYYEQNWLGFNYRITDIQCALGISQLKKLESFIQKRRAVVDAYNAAFDGVASLTTPYESPSCRSNFHLYVLRFDFKKIGTTRTELMTRLKEKGIQTQVHYIPVYLQPFYKSTFGTERGLCPETEKYYEECLSVPLYPEISRQDVGKVIATVKQFSGA